MVQVEWAERAVADLQSIYDYIDRDSSRYAQSMVERITSATERLRRNPESGGTVPELTTGYREILVQPYRILYRHETTTNRVLILAVIHGRRDLATALQPDE